VDLQPGLDAVADGSPLRSEEAFLLSTTVAAERHAGQLVVYNASGILYSCPEEDEEQVRLGVALLLTTDIDVQVQRLAEFLGKDPATLWRIRKRYEREGVGGIPYKYEGRPPHKLTEERLEEAQALLDEGASRRRVAEAVGVTAGAIQYAIGKGKLTPRAGRRRAKGQAPSPRERNAEDRATEGGVAVKRVLERALAATGGLEEAPPEFERAESVERAGVLLALPVLVAQGFFDLFQKVYGRLTNGFYGLNSVVATLAFMALLRIRTPEQLSSYAPGEFGRLLGLDRAPEVKTLRRKLLELGAREQSLELVDVFARRWIEDQGEEILGFLYVDGHVRPYHGRTHTLPKTWVPRRRLAMPATTDFWVNDTFGDPWFVLTAEANDGMVSMMDGEILPQIREYVGLERRLTVVFDRAGWSPESFERWHEKGIDILTYRKGPYEPWAEGDFSAAVKVPGRKEKLRLAEAPLKLSKEFEVREIRALDEKGKQVSIVTTRSDLSPLEIVSRMSARWRQENFFRYMRHEFALDHLPTYAVEAADPDRRVPNPARTAKDKELKRLRKELTKAQAALGQADDTDATTSLEPLRQQVAAVQATIDTAKSERAKIPKKVPLRDLLDERQIVRLEQERKRITDVIKMAAYRAETELAALVGPSLGIHHRDEARSFLKNVFNLPADLLPDEEAGTLTVRLYGMANPRFNRALVALCTFFKEQQAYNACFPGTRLRIVLEPPALLT
jgi:transposase